MNISAIKNYSTCIGKNPLLVQGAGGNISWKEDNTLWIKASGTWLADANDKNIFVGLDLNKTKAIIAENKTDLSGAIISNQSLRPSIETSLHALLPQKIVLHIHAVEVLAHAVLKNAQTIFAKFLHDLNWLWVDYVMPGLPLTKKIAALLNTSRVPNIIILGNHGLVVAGDTIDEIDQLLKIVLIRCQIKPREYCEPNTINLKQINQNANYQIPNNLNYHSLALDPILFSLTKNKWVMYPDHAIFLGANATFQISDANRSPCIIVPTYGVLINKNITRAQEAMLNCYINVGLRIADPNNVISLNDDEIASLLNWDAEKYRQQTNRAIKTITS